MGTRHLTIVKHNGKTFGQYGQWDGYPEGCGVSVLWFIKERMDEKRLKVGLAAAKFLDTDEISARWKKHGADGSGFVNMEVASSFGREFPQLDSDMGSKILDYLQESESPEVNDSLLFAADSLFCEWAWMLDLDNQTLRCFKGWNQKPLEDGQFFADMTPERQGEYWPVREVCSFQFDVAKTMSEADFLAYFKDEEDE